MFNLIFFGVPLIFVVLFLVTLARYRYAKKKNEEFPGTVSEGELKSCKVTMILAGIGAGIIIAIELGFIILFATAVSLM